MTDNDVRDEGAKALSEMLKVNTTLTSLNLNCEDEKRSAFRERTMNDRQQDWR